jgi:hypothetical protein
MIVSPCPSFTACSGFSSFLNLSPLLNNKSGKKMSGKKFTEKLEDKGQNINIFSYSVGWSQTFKNGRF